MEEAAVYLGGDPVDQMLKNVETNLVKPSVSGVQLDLFPRIEVK